MAQKSITYVFSKVHCVMFSRMYRNSAEIYYSSSFRSFFSAPVSKKKKTEAQDTSDSTNDEKLKLYVSLQLSNTLCSYK